MNIDEEIKLLKDKLYELENAPLPIDYKPKEVDIEPHPAVVRAQSPLLNYLDMHPQKISNSDWAWMYFELAFYPACVVLLLIYLALIDY